MCQQWNDSHIRVSKAHIAKVNSSGYKFQTNVQAQCQENDDNDDESHNNNNEQSQCKDKKVALLRQWHLDDVAA